MKLKNVVASGLALALALSLTACGGGKTAAPAQTAAPVDLLEDIQARGTIVIATEGDWSPVTDNPLTHPLGMSTADATLALS